MSIGKFQEKFLHNKGCATVMTIGMAAVFVFFGWTQSCGRNQLGGQSEQDPTVATVGDVPVTNGELTTAVTNMSAQRSGPGAAAPTYQDSVMFESEAITGALNQAAQYYIVEQDHVPTTDAALTAAAAEAIQPEIEQVKMQLMMSGKVKPTATPKDIDDAFKKATGKTPDEAVASTLENIKANLADSTKRQKIITALAPFLLQQALEQKMAPSDAVLKASYDTATIKRIFLSSAKGADAAGKAKAALAAIKGGMSFDAAMDKFSADPPPFGKGKKVSDATLPVPVSTMATNPEYKSLVGQKQGFISDVIDDPMGKVIYEIVSIHNDAPKDLQTNIAKYRKDYSRTKVEDEIQKQTKSVLASSALKWDNEGYKALYDYSLASQEPDPVKKKAALTKVVDEATKARNSSPIAGIYATYALFGASNALYTAPGADKGAMRDQRIEVLNDALQNTEDYDLRMELVDLYTQKKDGVDALTNLVAASRSNMQYDPIGQRRFGDIAAKGSLLVAQKLITAAQVKQLDTAQADWRKGKEESDRETAEMQAQMAKNEKENAAALEKQKAAAKKAGGAPGATPSGSQTDAENDKKNMELLEKQKKAAAPGPAANPGKGPTTPPPANPGGTSPTKP